MILPILITVAAFFLILLTGELNSSYQFNRQVRTLFLQSKSISEKNFTYAQLAGQPEPVQRYFKHLLKDGQLYISYVSMTHGGQFKTGINKAWLNIKGKQYATTEKPGFIWKGTTNMFTAFGMYICNKGRLIVSLLCLYNIINAKGHTYTQGELLRWLWESVLYPTNLLPSERLKWFSINDTKQN